MAVQLSVSACFKNTWVKIGTNAYLGCYGVSDDAAKIAMAESNKGECPASAIQKQSIDKFSSFTFNNGYTVKVTKISDSSKGYAYVEITKPASGGTVSGGTEYVFEFSGPLKTTAIAKYISQIVVALGGQKAYVESNKLVVVL